MDKTQKILLLTEWELMQHLSAQDCRWEASPQSSIKLL